MTIELPRKRQQFIGKNMAKIPNRYNVPRINPASDPGGKGGPSNIPLGAFGGGEGLEAAGKNITAAGISGLEEVQKERIKAEKLDAKMLDDIQKNKILKTIDNYKAELDTLNKNFDWSREYKNEDGTERQPQEVFTSIYDTIRNKYIPSNEKKTGIADSFTDENHLSYDAKYHAAGLEAAMSANDNQKTVTDTQNTERIRNKLNEFYVKQGGGVGTPDLTIGGSIPIIEQIAKDHQGSLTDMAIDSEIKSYITGWYQRRVEFLRQPLKSGVADTYQAINDLTERMRQQYPEALQSEVLKETQEALTAIAQQRYKSSAEQRKVQAEAEQKKVDRNEFNKARISLDKQYPNRFTDKNEALRHHNDLNTLKEGYGYSTTDFLKADIKDTVYSGTGQVIQKGKPVAEKPLILKENDALIQFDADGKPFEAIKNEAEIKAEVPDWVDKNGKINVKTTGEIRIQIAGMFGVPFDSKGNNLAPTKENRVFISKFKNSVTEILLRKNDKGNYTTNSLDDAINTALEETPADQLPKSFNFVDMANTLAKVLPDGTVIVNNKNTYARGSSTYKWEGVEKTSDKIRSEITEDFKTIKKYQQDGTYDKIKMGDATGIPSGLIDFFGSALGSFIKGAVSEDVTIARFQYGLLVRDFIRKFTLSPRFAVKEQELLRAMFPGPGAWNAPDQAAAAMREFDNELDNSVRNNLMIVAADGISSEDKLDAIKDLRYIVGMKNRLAKFDLSGRSSATEKSPVTLGSLSDAQLQQFNEDDPAAADRFIKEHEAKKALREGTQPSKVSVSPAQIEETKPEEISKNAADLTLVDLETMSLEEAGQTLAKMPVEEIFKRWEGTPLDIRKEWGKKLDNLIRDALNRPADIDYTGVESKPKKVKKKKGKK